MSAGHDRERKVKLLLELEGWFVIRAAASLGFADLVALKAGEQPQMIEVKSNASGGPYMNFRRDDREALRAAAVRAGAVAMLAFWPKRGELRWIDSSAWP